MTQPRLVACHFTGNSVRWPRLARVFTWTVAQHCAHWDVQIAALAPPVVTGGAPLPYYANTHKLAHWTAAVLEARDGDALALLDADTAVLRPLDPVWDVPFDLAYTVKPGAQFPFNGGVVFVRVREAVRAFFRAWALENGQLLETAHVRQPWRFQYGGVNQASFASLLERDAHGLALARLPCREWNCEDSTWSAFDPAVTRILHVKTALRRSIFLVPDPTPPLSTLSALWLDLERQSAARTARAQ